jgi:hypothetical protein
MNQERIEFERQLIERAWKDNEFREALRTNAKQVLAEEFGTHLPEGLELEVLEETPNKAYFVLPVDPMAAVELSEEELEVVAGGVDEVSICSALWCSKADIN